MIDPDDVPGAVRPAGLSEAPSKTGPTWSQSEIAAELTAMSATERGG